MYLPEWLLSSQGYSVLLTGEPKDLNAHLTVRSQSLSEPLFNICTSEGLFETQYKLKSQTSPRGPLGVHGLKKTGDFFFSLEVNTHDWNKQSRWKTYVITASECQSFKGHE